MPLLPALTYLTLSIILLACNTPEQQQTSAKKPNILLIVADDLGYADLGCYGGDIETDNIDQLADHGLRFSRFHTSPYCAPTRAMLLSGNDNHIAGMGNQGRIPGYFGYEGHLTDRIVTIPQMLQQAGYHTSMAGKWHLGMEPENNPVEKGFERSFAMLRGVANHYNDQGVFEESPISPYTEDGDSTTWPIGAYSTDFYTDKLIEFIDEATSNNQPFFSFAAFTSPHWPLQVDKKHWQKYIGRYDEGYEVLKRERLISLKSAGMIPEDAILPESHGSVIPWDSLSEEEKKIESRKMELYAGMVDNLDDNVGRLINHLKQIEQYDNTLIIFMSDNGAAAEDFYNHDYFSSFIRKHFVNTYENMGDSNSYYSYGPQWAEAGSSPFRYYKSFTTQGGIIAPMIISGPMIEKSNEIHHGFITLLDLAPSFYDLAGVTYPEEYMGKSVYPLKGESMIPFLLGESEEVHGNGYVFGLEHRNKAMIRKGDWKITNSISPIEEKNFTLHHIATDLSESHDMKENEPEKFRELIEEWKKFSEEIQVQNPFPNGD